MFFGVLNFFFNRFPNISINIHNIYTVAQVDFSVMSICKSRKFLICWNNIFFTINTLQYIITLRSWIVNRRIHHAEK